jgi:hypothetical protein
VAVVVSKGNRVNVANANGEPHGSPFATASLPRPDRDSEERSGYSRTLRKNVTPERWIGR